MRSKGRKKQSVKTTICMPKPNQADTKPTDDKKETFEDLVGKEQSANNSADLADKPDAPDKGDQSKQKPDAQDKAGQDGGFQDQSGGSSKKEDQPPAGEGAKPNPEDDSGEGNQLFWGKFKTEDDAKKSYDEAQSKIIDQGRELNDFKKRSQENEDFLNTLDKVLLNNPELADQLKSAIAGEMKGKTDKELDKDEDEEFEDEDIDVRIDKKLEEREKRAKIKKDRDDWIAKHPDFKKPELGHKVLDLLEAEGLPFTAKTLDIAYHYVTKEEQTKKAKDEAIKKEEVADLERQEASSVGGGEPSPKGKTPQENPFDDFVGNSINPNIVRT